MTLTTSGKTLILSLLALFLFASCNRSTKLIDTGDYDQAIHVSVKKLAGKTKKKEEHVLALEEAFARANSRDLNTIAALKEQNRPENWVRIYDIYDQINRRQDLISPLTPLEAETGYLATFRFLRINQEQNEAAEGAAKYYYDRGVIFLNQARNENDRGAARNAYGNFGRATDYIRGYSNAIDLRREAEELGISHIILQFAKQFQYGYAFWS